MESRRNDMCLSPPSGGLPASFFAELSPTPSEQALNDTPPKTPPFSALPPDIRDLIMEKLGSDLGRFAAVDRASALAARRDSAWKRAYMARMEELDCEAHLPDGMFRSCLLRQAGHKPGMTPTEHS
mmetsp:Transcript_30186/g.82574  ORF Transcript_30186/g.82574 Transcript_30186/m.82574 type:complete len:126 (-) Transcript_30186:472-849(-)|eukprot:scaffold18786_cov31-Tisochrysis_lutea.AAC.1